MPSPAEADLEFEVALRTWSAQEKIVKEACAISELLNLDPALAEEIPTACRGGNADQGR